MTIVRGLTGVLLAVTVGYGLAFKLGRLPARPGLFATLVALLLAGLLACLAAAISSAVRHRERRARHAAAAVALGGLVLAFGAGLANWLYGLQGLVILSELDTVPLSMTAHLQEFHAGPLSDVDEMRLTLQLESLELLPGDGGEVVPASRIRLLRDGRPVETLEVRPGRAAPSGTLRFFQGAFGFSPRIVILQGEQPVFDRVVPFTTRRHGAAGLSFEEQFRVGSEELEVVGRVDLSSLDEALRGHAKLDLAVSRQGRLLGAGELLPGHFADIEEGYRIGFAGLEKWSEIDLSRRNYGGVVLAGLAIGVAGAAAWPLAARSRR